MKPGDPAPVWEQGEFRIGDRIAPVLEYDSGSDGWTNGLTTFHEESAGSSHFIDRASREYALRQLLKHVREESPVILEVGCSSGFMIRLIRQHLPHAIIMGSDVVSEPLKRLAASMPGIPLVEFDLVRCPLPDGIFDALVLLNVLEHIDDDQAAVEQVHRVLKYGGVALIEVPAGPHLYDVYDKMLLHRRRYRLSELTVLLENAGFKIMRKSHLGFFLYPGFWAVKKRNKRLFSIDKTTIQQVVEQNIRDTGNSRILNILMRIESFLGRWISYPFGIRSLLTCVKPLQTKEGVA